ncbi:MAG: glycosyltransferase, partial [Desulfobacterales bacterium]
EYKKSGNFPLLHYQTVGIAKGYYPCREVAELPGKPVISIVTPVYNTDELLLKKCIHSVLYQAYPHWELCLVDDGSSQAHVKRILNSYAEKDARIKVTFFEQNRGISNASNAAVAMASGDYIGFLDHDDELTLNALFEIVKAINKFDSDIIYTDEDLVNREGRYLHSFYKPDYNAELLLSHNYINHFVAVKGEIFERSGGFSQECDGAQDYDLLLKLTEQTEKVHHLAQALYYWRAIETSTSLNHTQKVYADVAGRKALESALQRRKMEAIVKPVKPGYYPYHYHVERKLLTYPPVSALLVVRDIGDDAEKWINTIVQSTKYPHVEFLCLFLAALDDELFTHAPTADANIKMHAFKDETNISKILNQTVAKTQGTYLLFLEQNTEPCNADWIELLLGYSQMKKTGAVGGLVQFPATSKLQIDALPDLENKSWEYYRAFFQSCSRHLNGLFCAQNVLAVSTDLCMVKRNLFEAVNGFDEDELSTIMYDSDFCLRLRKKGVENVYTPFCRSVCDKKIVPHVSDEEAANELAIFRGRWKEQLITGDPYYNINRILNADSITRQQWIKWFTGFSITEQEKSKPYRCKS